FYIMEPWRVIGESTMTYRCDIYGRILNDNGQVIFADYGMGKVLQHVVGNVPEDTSAIIFKNNSIYDVSLNFRRGWVDSWAGCKFTLQDNNTWTLHLLNKPQFVLATLQLPAIISTVENDFTTFQFDAPVMHQYDGAIYWVSTP